MKEIWDMYTSILIGAMTGLIIALLILVIGFLKTLVLLIFVLAGAITGWAITNTEVKNYIYIKKRK